MSATKQTQAISVANEIIALAGQLKSILDTSTSLSARYQNQGIQSVLQALPTCALNADGSLGTADVSPTTGNPIDTRILTTLNRSAKASEIIAAKNMMNDFISFMSNAAVTTVDRSNISDKLVGG